jgi:hypothetical protein
MASSWRREKNPPGKESARREQWLMDFFYNGSRIGRSPAQPAAMAAL